MKGKIFLTGGTGSLGRAILKRSQEHRWDCQFTIFSRDEVKQGELKSSYPEHKFVLGDIRDYDWLSLAMRGHNTIIHTAAYKQVPAAEVNAGEAVETNVIGSRNVIRAAIVNNVATCLGISSDKACAPINCYGETKALMEKMFQQANLFGTTKFVLTRYGNVLGSRGSVVPFFREQMKRGEITITNENMTRFWLTMEEAVDLVEESMDIPRGCILVPMASASTMRDLARAVAPDCAVRLIGIRPGEKMHEQLIHKGESMNTLIGVSRFLVYPAFFTSAPVHPFYDSTADVFEYSSDNAPMLSPAALRNMIE